MREAVIRCPTMSNIGSRGEGYRRSGTKGCRIKQNTNLDSPRVLGGTIESERPKLRYHNRPEYHLAIQSEGKSMISPVPVAEVVRYNHTG